MAHKDEPNDDLLKRIEQLKDQLCSLRVSKDSWGNFSQEKQNEPRKKDLQSFACGEPGRFKLKCPNKLSC